MISRNHFLTEQETTSLNFDFCHRSGVYAFHFKEGQQKTFATLRSDPWL